MQTPHFELDWSTHTHSAHTTTHLHTPLHHLHTPLHHLHTALHHLHTPLHTHTHTHTNTLLMGGQGYINRRQTEGPSADRDPSWDYWGARGRGEEEKTRRRTRRGDQVKERLRRGEQPSAETLGHHLGT